jgi:hypothetical protein
MSSLPSSTSPSSASPSSALTLYQPALLQLVAKPMTTLVIVNAEIKAGIQDFSAILSVLDAKTTPHQTQVLVLAADCDGIEQITASLLHSCREDQRQIERIHILAQGRPGGVKLGANWLGQPGLEAHSAALQSWQATLTSGAEIVLHCPNVAIGIEGMGFLGRLSQLTGAMVVASHLSIGQTAALRRSPSPISFQLPLAG